jgi:hypothetical protein
MEEHCIVATLWGRSATRWSDSSESLEPRIQSRGTSLGLPRRRPVADQLPAIHSWNFQEVDRSSASACLSTIPPWRYSLCTEKCAGPAFAPENGRMHFRRRGVLLDDMVHIFSRSVHDVHVWVEMGSAFVMETSDTNHQGLSQKSPKHPWTESIVSKCRMEIDLPEWLRMTLYFVHLRTTFTLASVRRFHTAWAKHARPKIGRFLLTSLDMLCFIFLLWRSEKQRTPRAFDEASWVAFCARQDIDLPGVLDPLCICVCFIHGV